MSELGQISIGAENKFVDIIKTSMFTEVNSKLQEATCRKEAFAALDAHSRVAETREEFDNAFNAINVFRILCVIPFVPVLDTCV